YRRYFIRIPFHLTALILFPRHLRRSKRQRVQRRELPRPDRLRRGGSLDCARDDRDRALKLEALSKPTRRHAGPGVMLNLVQCWIWCHAEVDSASRSETGLIPEEIPKP